MCAIWYDYRYYLKNNLYQKGQYARRNRVTVQIGGISIVTCTYIVREQYTIISCIQIWHVQILRLKGAQTTSYSLLILTALFHDYQKVVLFIYHYNLLIYMFKQISLLDDISTKVTVLLWLTLIWWSKFIFSKQSYLICLFPKPCEPH